MRVPADQEFLMCCHNYYPQCPCEHNMVYENQLNATALDKLCANSHSLQILIQK